MNFYMWGGCELDDSMSRVQAKLPDHKFVSMGTSTIGILVLLEARHVFEAFFVTFVDFIVAVSVCLAIVVCEAYDYSLAD